MRVVVDRGSLFPYQSARIEGSLCGPSMFPEGDSVDTCLNEAGQSDSHNILELNGRTILFPPLLTGDRHMELVPCMLSRHHHDSSNWELCQAVFETLNYLMGPFSLDLFASRIGPKRTWLNSNIRSNAV